MRGYKSCLESLIVTGVLWSPLAAHLTGPQVTYLESWTTWASRPTKANSKLFTKYGIFRAQSKPVPAPVLNHVSPGSEGKGEKKRGKERKRGKKRLATTTNLSRAAQNASASPGAVTTGAPRDTNNRLHSYTMNTISQTFLLYG